MHIVHRAALAAAMLLPLGAMSSPPVRPSLAVASDPEALAQAATRFRERVLALDSSGAAVTALKAPADLALLRAAFDAAAVRALPDDLVTVFGPCKPIAEAYEALVAFASKPRPGSDVGRQVLSVQDELVFATIATDLCAKKSLRAATPFVVSLGEVQRDSARRGGVRMMQNGAQLIISGILMIQSDPGISAANRAKLVTAMLEDIDVVAEAMAPAERAKLRAEILRYAGSADAVTKPRLQQAARAFERTDCGTLCTFAKE